MMLKAENIPLMPVDGMICTYLERFRNFDILCYKYPLNHPKTWYIRFTYSNN